MIAHELGHRASPYRKEDRVRAQWARTTVRMTPVVASLAVVELAVLAAMVATYTAVLLEMASVSVGLAVIGPVLMQPLVRELHAAEFAADDYAADHTGTAATVESLTQLRSRTEPAQAWVPFFNTHPSTTVRIERQRCRAAASSPPG